MKTGQFYHVYNRGNNRERIFKEEKNYVYFLKRFQDYLSEWVDVYAYCLMPNHFHLLVKIPDFPEITTGLTPAEKAFKNFFTSYAKSINKGYGRTGSLFQSNYKKKLK